MTDSRQACADQRCEHHRDDHHYGQHAVPPPPGGVLGGLQQLSVGIHEELLLLLVAVLVELSQVDGMMG